MKELAMFWGCTIPARFPFIEKATRLVLGDLGAHLSEPGGFTCCPEASLVQPNGLGAFYLTAARNLAVARASAQAVITPCNGCYSTFRKAQAHLATHRREAEIVNELLAGEDLQWVPDQPILHLAEWLVDSVGIATAAGRVVKDLAGMRLAVHYGCHLLRPQPAVRWDDPLQPHKLEDLVAALGARVVDYPTKMQCCGAGLDRSGERVMCLDFARRKLNDMRANGAEALVVACPSCFQQFDLNQAALLRAGDEIGLPVLYLSELLALAIGHTPDEIGLDGHRVSLEPFLAAWDGRLAARRRAAEAFDMTLLEACGACNACKDDCPVATIDASFQPDQLIAAVLRGDLDRVLAGRQAWKCLDCFTCRELCPSAIGMAETFRILKSLSIADGSAPDGPAQAFAQLAERGVLGTPREAVRAKLGLAPLPPAGGEALHRLLAVAPSSSLHGDDR